MVQCGVDALIVDCAGDVFVWACFKWTYGPVGYLEAIMGSDELCYYYYTLS